MSTRIRIGIIGTGGISHAHANGFLKHPGAVECTAICDLNAASRARLKEKLAADPAEFGDWKEMLEKAGDRIDAVLVCLPHHLHAPAILDACRARKHVLCEKPMCTSTGEADAIAAAVKGSGITYMSAHNQLFLPFFRQFKRMLDDGAIGRLYWLRSQDCFVNRANFEHAWRGNAKLQGGGELIDTGYHPSYRLLEAVREPAAAVHCAMGRFFMTLEGEDTATVQVRFANGVIGEVFTSWAMPLPWGSWQMHAIGSKGQLFGSGQELCLLPEGAREPARFTVQGDGDTFSAQLLHFAECLRDGKRPPHSVEEGRAVLDLILQAGASAEGWRDTAQVKA